jgi:ABC-type transporter Mla subunit MlaD
MALALLFAARLASAGALPLVVDVENSKGLRSGDAVMFEAKRIGDVTDVGFGERDTVEIKITIGAIAREQIHKSGTFVVNEAVAGKRPSIEYFVIDAKSSLAEPHMRFRGARSLAEVWLRRGRISADELSRAMSQGVEQFRRNLEELQRSPEWDKFKDQVARLSAQLTVTGRELTRLLNDQLPKLQKELDDLYAQYQKELRKAEPERTPTP